MRAGMAQSFLAQALIKPEAGQAVYRPLFQNPRSHPPLDIGAGLPLNHHCLDTAGVEEVGKDKSGGAGSDDSDLCAHVVS